MPETTKITKLTGMNVKALRETLTEDQAKQVDIGATVVTFKMPQDDAYRLMCDVKDAAARKHGSKGHPVQSLHAIIRKIKPNPGN